MGAARGRTRVKDKRAATTTTVQQPHLRRRAQLKVTTRNVTTYSSTLHTTRLQSLEVPVLYQTDQEIQTSNGLS